MAGTFKVGRAGKGASQKPADGEDGEGNEAGKGGASESEEVDKAAPSKANRRQSQKRRQEAPPETDAESGSQDEGKKTPARTRRKRKVSSELSARHKIAP